MQPRHDWARYAGSSGYDPIVGYSTRWAKQRTKKAEPFLQHRSISASNLDLGAALQPLNIRPVERPPPPPPPPPPPAPQMYRVMSMADLAPDIEERPQRRPTDYNVSDSSQMASFLTDAASAHR